MIEVNLDEIRNLYSVPYVTHYEDCWKSHTVCCIHKLCDEIERMRALECINILDSHGIVGKKQIESLMDCLNNMTEEEVEKIKNEY